MKAVIQIILIMLSFNISLSYATTFYIDPIKGIDPIPNQITDGNGTESNPWRTLEGVINANLIETKNSSGEIINKNMPIKAGDKIILKSGYHGFIKIKNAFNDDYITITAGAKQKPILSGLEIMSARNWRFSKLTISPIFANTESSNKSIVTIGENNFLGNCSHITLADSHIYSFSEPAETLTSNDWGIKAKTGITMGRHATKLKVVNNYINSVDFGINIISKNSSVQGNVVTDFSMDGMRAVVSNILIEDNVIKNNYVVNGNHPDGIQGFAFNQKNTLSDVVMVGNIILNRDKKESLSQSILPINSYSGTLQGIGFFDGPIENIQAENNIIMSFTWPGLSLYDSFNGKMINNVVFTPEQISNAAARITLGTKGKDKGGNEGNTIVNNFAHDYIIKESNRTIKERSGNMQLAVGTGKTLFMNRLKTRIEEINMKYGTLHPVSNQPRINEKFISDGVSSIF